MADREWNGALAVNAEDVLFVGTAQRLESHTVQATTVILGLDSAVRVEVHGHAPVIAGGVVIPAQVPHRLIADGAQTAILHVASMGGAPSGDVKLLSSAQLNWLRSPLTECLSGRGTSDFAVRARSVVQEVDAKLSVRRAPRVRDARVARLLEAYPHVHQELPSLETLARTAKLSPERFRHLFQENVGMSFRYFTLWRRFRHALAEMTQQPTITAAAHAAGFADAAHLSRTFKRLTGVAPSALLARTDVSLVDPSPAQKPTPGIRAPKAAAVAPGA